MVRSSIKVRPPWSIQTIKIIPWFCYTLCKSSHLTHSHILICHLLLQGKKFWNSELQLSQMEEELSTLILLLLQELFCENSFLTRFLFQHCDDLLWQQLWGFLPNKWNSVKEWVRSVMVPLPKTVAWTKFLFLNWCIHYFVGEWST